MNPSENKTNTSKSILKKLGWAGFLFFLIKGLLWLAAIFWGGSTLMEGCS